MGESYDDEEYECVDGVHEYSNDCFDMAAEYVDGLQECEYWEQIDCESWEQISCDVAALVDDEWIYATCDEMMDTYGIPEPSEDDGRTTTTMRRKTGSAMRTVSTRRLTTAWTLLVTTL